jgi:integrase
MFTVKAFLALVPGRHRDERGLYVDVSPDGRTRRFVLRFVSPVTHRATEAGLGVYPATGLADARAKAAQYRAAIARGEDPIHAKRAKRAAKLAEDKPKKTIRDALTAYCTNFASKPTTPELAKLLERHVLELLSHPLALVTPDDILQALEPLQAQSPKTAARVRGTLAIIFDYAIALRLHMGVNPAAKSVFKFLLPPTPASTPHRMMPYGEVPGFYARLAATPSASHLCLQWLILTASRSQEAIKAEWSEIDLDARLWTIPAHKIKMKRVHKVPLSAAALAVLDQAALMFGVGRYVFPGATKGSPQSSRTLESVMHRKMQEPYAVHGFRASFSSYAHDCTEFPHELIEMALAHIEGRGNAVARAYNRTDALERRRALMNAWGRFVTGEAAATNLVQFARA